MFSEFHCPALAVRSCPCTIPAHFKSVAVCYEAMAAWSPTLEGFRAMLRRPSVSLAEIIWRWSFGAAACVLVAFGMLKYLDTLPVSNIDLWLLRTRHPFLISQAFSHILHGSAYRLVLAAIVLASALALLWIFVAACGRGATLGPLLDYVQDRADKVRYELGVGGPLADESQPENAGGWRLRSLAGLHLLRVGLGLAACAGIVGAAILGGFVSTVTHPHPGAAFLLSFLFVMLVWLLWSSVSWFLSVASIFVVRRGRDTLAALSDAVDLCRDHFGPVIAVGTWFGLAHLVLFIIATSVVSFPLAFAGFVPGGIVLSVTLLLTLVYFAIVDTLYIGRLAGYVAILEAPPLPPPARILPPDVIPSGLASSTPLETDAVDQEELILSDTPPAGVSLPHSAPSSQSSARVDQDELIVSDSSSIQQ